MKYRTQLCEDLGFPRKIKLEVPRKFSPFSVWESTVQSGEQTLFITDSNLQDILVEFSLFDRTQRVPKRQNLNLVG